MIATTSSTMFENSLAVLISDLVQSTPSEIIQEVLDTIQSHKGDPPEVLKIKLLAAVHSPQVKSKLIKLLDDWTALYPSRPPESLYLAIQSSLITSQSQIRPSTELIWTGPQQTSTPFRRTDQALLELITGAKEQLLVVSFVVYKARPIIEAIENAVLRNIKVIICLEDSGESQGKLIYSGANAFASSIFRLATFYTWPSENRPLNPDGKFGSLHAKTAVADQTKVFISSANLTDYAMDLNMEMGVLIEDQLIGKQIDDLFKDMILNNVLRAFTPNFR